MWRWARLLQIGCGRVDFEATADAGTDAALACPAGYAPLGPSANRYRTLGVLETWQTHQATCVADGTRLAIPVNQAELDALVTGGEVWLGLSDLAVEGTFMTVVGTTPPFLPWAPTQPDNFNANEDCVLGLTTARLDDRPCAFPRRAICECRS
jgi:hypothetical protein